MRTAYTETHPDVRALLRRIQHMESESGLSAQNGTEEAVTPADLNVAKVEARIESVNSRLASLLEQRKALQAQVKGLEQRILETPQVERNLITLMRDHESAQRKYEEVRARQVDARILESLEEDKKAERFSLLEPPLRADRPTKPDRPKLLALGFVFAAGSASGLGLLLELLKQRIRGAAALAQLTGQPPLVVLPYITTRAEIRRRRLRLMLLLLAVLALLLLAAAAIHYLYKPLDLLFYKILVRLS